MRFFDDIGAAFRGGEITDVDVSEWATFLYDDDAELGAKIKQCYNATGDMVQFQIVTLHKMAQDKQKKEPPPAAKLSEIPVPAELMRDVPEPVYDEPLPDMAAEIKSRLGIIAAVRKFGKAQDHIRERSVEGIKVRCPMTDHNDYDPSAWCNTEKNTWYCGKCMVGGDVIDFYAARQGHDPKKFHSNGQFPDVVKEMGAELGLSVRRNKSSGTYELVEDGEDWPSPLPDRPEATDEAQPRDVAPEQPEYGEAPAPADPPKPVAPPSHEALEPITLSVDKMMEGVAYDLDDVLDEAHYDEGVPELNWRDLPINPNTFLATFMEYAEEFYAWVPPEYFFFAGLQAVGLATGHHTTSFTGAKLSGSLMLAMIGPSGGGKSTAVKEIRQMFLRVPATHFSPDTGKGIKVLPSPGSAEALIKSIRTEVADVSVDPPVMKEVGVTAWLHEDEFATLMSKGKRIGSTLKPRLIQLHDFVKTDPSIRELVVEDYSMSGGYRTLSDSYFSAVFTTQTDAIRSMMESVDLISGFLNRIIPVMGRQRERRRISDTKIPPHAPDHDDHYARLWARCRSTWHTVPFTDGALELVDSHPFLYHIEKLSSYDSLYSRVQHMTLRLGFLLAVNNWEDEVDERYVEAACGIGSQYLMNCFSRLRGAVIANENDECAQRIFEYVKRYYDKHGTWPGQYQWSKDRSYSAYTSEVRNKALDSLFHEGRVIRVKLTNGKAVEKAMLIPSGSWAGYAESHDKKYVKTEFYGEVEAS